MDSVETKSISWGHHNMCTNGLCWIVVTIWTHMVMQNYVGSKNGHRLINMVFY
jgi:hypothetical protein